MRQLILYADLRQPVWFLERAERETIDRVFGNRTRQNQFIFFPNRISNMNIKVCLVFMVGVIAATDRVHPDTDKRPRASGADALLSAVVRTSVMLIVMFDCAACKW